METTHNTNPLGPGTSNKRTVQWWFKKFCKGDDSLEDEKWSGHLLEIDSNQLRGSSKLILQLHENLPKNSMSAILWSFDIWEKLEMWKSSISGCLMSWLQIKKIIVLKCHLLLSYTTINYFSIRLWCATKNGFYVIMDDDQLLVALRRSSKALPKAKFAPKKKRPWSLFGGLLLI